VEEELKQPATTRRLFKKTLSSKRQKKVGIHHHHTKPYRKRHIASLALLSVVAFSLGAAVVRYNKTIQQGVSSALAFMQGESATQDNPNKSIESTYGFSVSYDTHLLYATGVDAVTGKLYLGSELRTARSYDTIRMATSLGETSNNNSSFTLKYYTNTPQKDPNDLNTAESVALQDITQNAISKVKKTDTKMTKIGGKDFIQSEWEYSSDNTLLAGLKSLFTTYTTTHEGRVFTVQVVHGIGTQQRAVTYDNVIASIYFGKATAPLGSASKPIVLAKSNQSFDALDVLLLSSQVSAESSSNIPTSQTISSLYSPAVVKIFSLYCYDIYFDDTQVLKDACNGTTGSGFFITSDGYIASNGHVTSADPKDIMIEFAYSNYKKGDTRLLDFLATKQQITSKDLPDTTSQERADALFNLFYAIDAGRITTKNGVHNLLVSYGREVPDVNELVALTKSRKIYPEQAKLRHSKPIKQDFRSIDGFSKFHASDVSIIKIDGYNYPAVKIGTINTLLQGANLNILGYPGNASQNGLVEAGLSTVTLTSGKVSAIKNALGSDKKLIETDTLIGHGNSGGPAFNDSGEVMGISTYTATKVGDSTFNYVRDIGDLQALAASASITLNQPGKTQLLWDKAIGQFSGARYSKALVNFAAVKAAYPAHPSVDDFIAASKQNIKDGKDVKDMPIGLMIAVLVLLLIAAGAVLQMILKHKRTHNVYKLQVQNGDMQVLQKGDTPVQVDYDPQHINAQKYVHTMTKN